MKLVSKSADPLRVVERVIVFYRCCQNDIMSFDVIYSKHIYIYIYIYVYIYIYI